MSSSKDSPAFPCDNPNSVYRSDEFTGLTKLEYFSAMAMQGALSNAELMLPYKKESEASGISERSLLATGCVSYAYELLKELREWDDCDD